MTWMFRFAVMLLASAVSFEGMGSSKTSLPKKTIEKTSDDTDAASVPVVESSSGKDTTAAEYPELSSQEMNKIYSILMPALENIQMTDIQRRDVINKSAVAAKAILDLGLKVSVDLSCPSIQKTLQIPLVQKSIDIRKMMQAAEKKKKTDTKEVGSALVDPNAQGEKYFSNLRERYNGILSPKDDKAAAYIEKQKFAKILKGEKKGSAERQKLDTPDRKGNLYLYDTFAIAGLPISKVVRNLKFMSNKGKPIQWDQVAVHRKATITGAYCKKRQVDKYPCSNWGHFQNHLKNCTFESVDMKACFAEAVESTKITELLQQYWRFIQAQNAGGSDENSSAVMAARRPDLPTWPDIKSFRDEEAFVNDMNVRTNAVWIFVLRELQKREVYHSAARILNKETRSKIITGMLEDVAMYLAKLQLIITASESKGALSGAASALTKGLTGGVATEAGNILKKRIPVYEKLFEAEEKDAKADEKKTKKEAKEKPAAATVK